jgi:predicted regulator of Ras-like GTPase activity (Roadblock/LC7/MglB family)
LRLPFKNLLKELVSSVEGATGAIVIEADGEAVQLYTEGDSERLRLRAAYITVAILSARASTDRLKLGDIGCLVFEYGGASFIFRELDRSYYLALELDDSANIGLAIYRAESAAAKLRRALTA